VPRKSAAATGEGSRLSDVAYGRILEVLFERRLPAGAFVSQADLVTLTGVPVGPLRDALRVLEAEGVLTIHPRTGIQFVKPGMELTRSTYQFRTIVETSAVATFAETAEDREIDELEKRHRDAIALIEREGLTPAALAELDALEHVMHGTIVGSLKNPLIDSSYRRIHNYLRLIRLERRLTPPLALRSLREHLTILAACRSRDVAAAVAALQGHFASALQRNLGLY